MLRTSLGLLAAVTFAGCAIDDNGNFEFCFHPGCDGGGDDGGSTPTPPPPHPIQFELDRGAGAVSNRLASDGVLQLDVRTRTDEVPTFTRSGDGFEVSLISAMPHLQRLELRGTGAGSGTLEATIPSATTTGFFLEVADVASIAGSIDSGAAGDRHVVMADVETLELHVVATDGKDVIDHSLAIDASSDPGFVQTRWDVVELPDSPGERVLAVTRGAGDVAHLSVRTVDHVDTLVADNVLDGAASGVLCVHAELDGERVKTFAYTFQGNDKVVVNSAFPANCASFQDAQPGATITAELAGTTAELVILPPLM